MQPIKKDGYIEVTVNFEEFLEILSPNKKKLLSDLLGREIEPPLQDLIYRGQSDSGHDLVPNFYRQEFMHLFLNASSFSDLCFIQYAYLKIFIKGCDLNTVNIPNDSVSFRDKYFKEYNTPTAFKPTSWPDPNLYELLALAQHYGHSTELLDWSYNPLVAFYFAASKAINSYKLNNTKDDINRNSLSIWVFDLERKNIFNQGKEKVFEIIDVPRSLNMNIASQQGCFSLIRQNINRDTQITYENNRVKQIKLLQDLTHEHKQEHALVKITLPHTEAKKVVDFCECYSINAATLFRNTEGAARYASDAKAEKLFEYILSK